MRKVPGDRRQSSAVRNSSVSRGERGVWPVRERKAGDRPKTRKSDLPGDGIASVLQTRKGRLPAQDTLPHFDRQRRDTIPDRRRIQQSRGNRSLAESRDNNEGGRSASTRGQRREYGIELVQFGPIRYTVAAFPSAGSTRTDRPPTRCAVRKDQGSPDAVRLPNVANHVDGRRSSLRPDADVDPGWRMPAALDFTRAFRGITVHSTRGADASRDRDTGTSAGASADPGGSGVTGSGPACGCSRDRRRAAVSAFQSS